MSRAERLFSRLFRAGSADRNRLEDFLTEIVADLLDRLPHHEQIEFCRNFLLPTLDSPSKREWFARAQRSERFIWATQVLIPVPGAGHYKRPDIVLYGADSTASEPLMVIECKVGARFTTGTIFDDDGAEPTSLGQLSLYDRWLSTASGPASSLVLLTHLASPPSDFLTTRGTYQVKLRSVRRWSELYDWLTKHKGVERWDQRARVLVDSLIDFLRENELMTEAPTLSDLAAARLYLCGGSHNRLAEAMDAARQAVLARFSRLKLKGFPNNPPRFYSTTASGWLFDLCQPGAGPSVGWGIFFVREDSEEWHDYEPPVSVFEGVYVNIDFPSAVARPKDEAYECWHFPTWKHERGQGFEVYRVAPIADMKGDFSVSFSNWVADRFEEALRLISATDGKSAAKR